MIDLKVFSERLYELIKENKLTQEKLAEKIDVDKNTISNYCLGITKPSIDKVMAIAKYFGVSIDYLVGYTIDIPVTVLMNNGLKRISGLNVTLEMQQISFGSTRHEMTMLRCSRHNNVKESKLFPRTDEADTISTFMNFDYIVEDVYYVINGNIYREANILDPNVEPEYKYSRIDVSVYDYVNDGNSLEPYKETYEKERFYLGVIGALSADEFYWLNYLLGYCAKVKAEASENE